MIAAGSIKGPFDWLWICVIILHVVGEHHQLCDIHESPEHFFGKAGVDTVVLRNDPIPVVGLLDFNKSERQPVNQQCDVGPKFILAVSIGQFSDSMVCVSAFILQVDNAQAVDAVQENFIKCPSQIAVLGRSKSN